MQLNLFTPVKEKQRYQWQSIFPDFMPHAGGMAQINRVIIKGFGYTSGLSVQIDRVEGETVQATTQEAQPRTIACQLADLWPPVSLPRQYW